MPTNWQDYTNERLYIKQITVPFQANTEITILPGKKAIFPLTQVITPDEFQLNFNLTGHGPVWITPEVSHSPYKLKFREPLLVEHFSLVEHTFQYQKSETLSYKSIFDI